MSSQPRPSNLIVGDSAGVAHFQQYRNDSYIQKFARSLGSASLDGVNVLGGSGLWTGADGLLNLRLGPAYRRVAWESPVIGSGFGRFVATDERNGEKRVFSSANYAVMGFTYTLP